MLSKINYIKGLCLAFGLSMFAMSCDTTEFLENENKANLNDQTQWESEPNADVFLNDVYSEIPNKWNLAENLDYYSDDYNISHYYTASNWRGGITAVPTQSTDNVWGGTHGPTYGYTWSSFLSKFGSATPS